MGRQIRTTVPQSSIHFTPKWTYRFVSLTNNLRRFKRRTSIRDIGYVSERRSRRVQKFGLIYGGAQPEGGRVVATDPSPRSYIIATPNGKVRRNRSQIMPLPELTEQTDSLTEPGSDSEEPPQRIVTRSQTGTAVVLYLTIYRHYIIHKNSNIHNQ